MLTLLARLLASFSCADMRASALDALKVDGVPIGGEFIELVLASIFLSAWLMNRMRFRCLL